MRKLILLFALFLPICSMAKNREGINVLEVKYLEMPKIMQILQMSDTFLKHLQDCSSYDEKRIYTLFDTKINAEYSISGKDENNNCRFAMSSSDPYADNFSVSCNLPQSFIDIYLNSFVRFSNKMGISTDNIENLRKDPDYLAMTDILEDRRYCIYRRKAIDFTKNIRQNLSTCQPIVETQNLRGLNIVRKIAGKNDETCKYQTLITIDQETYNKYANSITDNPMFLKKDNEYTALFSCSLDEHELQGLKTILEAQIVPEAYNIETIKVEISSRLHNAEMRFLREHCFTDDNIW